MVLVAVAQRAREPRSFEQSETVRSLYVAQRKDLQTTTVRYLRRPHKIFN
jgi:hypothetical protein